MFRRNPPIRIAPDRGGNMLASRELPAALVEMLYMKPSDDETQLLSYDRHLIALWNHTWNWIAPDRHDEILFSSKSLREVAAVLAESASQFEYAHMIVVTGTEGYEEESPWELFPIEQVFEEVGSLFENTPKFIMEFGTREFTVIPITTSAPRHYLNGSGESQVHLLYIPKELGALTDQLIFVNMKMDDENLDSSRWDKVEVGLLCGNELVVVQTYRGTAAHYSDSRTPSDFHRLELISIDEAKRFISKVAASVERDGDSFVDVWGKAVLTNLGKQLLVDE